MRDARHQRAGDQFMMGRLILYLILVLTGFEHQTGAGKRAVQQDINRKVSGGPS